MRKARRRPGRRLRRGDLGGAGQRRDGAAADTGGKRPFCRHAPPAGGAAAEERLFHELVGDARNPETGMPFASKAEFVAWRDGAAGRGRAQAAPDGVEALARFEAQLVNSSEPRTRSS